MKQNNSRRDFLKLAGQSIIVAPVVASLNGYVVKAQPSQTKTEPIPDKTELKKVKLNVRDFGAVSDGVTKDTAAIQQAIDRCWVLGGGEVLFPAGNYLTGAIALKSNTLLRLEKDATLIGTPDFDDYPIMQVRWEGKWIQGQTGLIYAINAENIGIVGPGKIAGNHTLGGRPNPTKSVAPSCFDRTHWMCQYSVRGFLNRLLFNVVNSSYLLRTHSDKKPHHPQYRRKR